MAHLYPKQQQQQRSLGHFVPLLVASLLLLFLVALAKADTEPSYQHHKYQYKHSFKSPHSLEDKHGNLIVPHWQLFGNAMISPDYVRLVPSVRSQKGAIWSELPNNFRNWQVDIGFLITGRGRLGGDGMAFWYTGKRGETGEAFGGPSTWDGMMIAFDTYDNDGQRNNPIVYGIINDDTNEFQMLKDGSDLLFGSCIRNFRNTQTVTHARIVYFENTLSVYVDTNEAGGAMKECFVQHDLELPSGFYFGISAATGGLADDHDIISFDVHEIIRQDPPSKLSESKISEEKLEKLANVEALMDRARKKKEEQMLGGETYVRESLGTNEEIANKLVRLSDEQTELKIMLQAVLNRIGTDSGVKGGSVNDRQILEGQNDLRKLINKLEKQFNQFQSDLENLKRFQSEGGIDDNGRQSVGDDSVIRNVQQTLARIESKIATMEVTLKTNSGSSSLLENIKEDLGKIKNQAVEGGGFSNAFIGIGLAVVVVIVLVVFWIFKKKDNDSKKFL